MSPHGLRPRPSQTAPAGGGRCGRKRRGPHAERTPRDRGVTRSQRPDQGASRRHPSTLRSGQARALRASLQGDYRAGVLHRALPCPALRSHSATHAALRERTVAKLMERLAAVLNHIPSFQSATNPAASRSARLSSTLDSPRLRCRRRRASSGDASARQQARDRAQVRPNLVQELYQRRRVTAASATNPRGQRRRLPP
jgi:hypothetical protein